MDKEHSPPFPAAFIAEADLEGLPGTDWVAIVDDEPGIDYGPDAIIKDGIVYIPREIPAKRPKKASRPWSYRRWDLDQRLLAHLAREAERMRARKGSSKGGRNGTGKRASTFERNEAILDRFEEIASKWEKLGSKVDQSKIADTIHGQATNNRDIDPIDAAIAAIKPGTVRNIITRGIKNRDK
jgi:hypothetical protein